MTMNMLMEIGVTQITGCEKGVHNSNRSDYRSGTRQHCLDTRLGTFNLQVLKFRKTGYVPFFSMTLLLASDSIPKFSKKTCFIFISLAFYGIAYLLNWKELYTFPSL